MQAKIDIVTVPSGTFRPLSDSSACLYRNQYTDSINFIVCGWLGLSTHVQLMYQTFKVLLNGRFENQVMYFLRHQTMPKHLGICLKEDEFAIFHTLRKIKGAFL